MSSSSHGGKGDRQRKANAKRFNDNWDMIFKEKKDVSYDEASNDERPKQGDQLARERNRNNEE
tara:strand:- start:519 stop:707 length:189 start_codon:yes stop_codon:yes gene_type:complete